MAAPQRITNENAVARRNEITSFKDLGLSEATQKQVVNYKIMDQIVKNATSKMSSKGKEALEKLRSKDDGK